MEIRARAGGPPCLWHVLRRLGLPIGKVLFSRRPGRALPKRCRRFGRAGMRRRRMQVARACSKHPRCSQAQPRVEAKCVSFRGVQPSEEEKHENWGKAAVWQRGGRHSRRSCDRESRQARYTRSGLLRMNAVLKRMLLRKCRHPAQFRESK